MISGERLRARLTPGPAARLCRYLHVLTQAQRDGRKRISSLELAKYTSINASQIRRDLARFGSFGTRGVGYSIAALSAQIRTILHTPAQHTIALVGAGRLGQAIAHSALFADHGLTIAAVFDIDAGKVGQHIGTTVVAPYTATKDAAHKQGIILALLAVPPAAAQTVTTDLADAGVRIIYDNSEALLHAPPDLTVHSTSQAARLRHALYLARS